MPAAPNPVLSVLADDTVSSEEFVCEHALSILIRRRTGNAGFSIRERRMFIWKMRNGWAKALTILSGIVISHGS